MSVTIKPHWRAFGVWYCAILLFGFGPGNNPDTIIQPWQGWVLAIIIGLAVVYHALTSRLIITSNRITRQGGLINFKPVAMEISDLGEVRILRGLIHKFLGVGVLVLIPKDKGPIVKFWGVPNPKAVKAKIDEIAGLV